MKKILFIFIFSTFFQVVFAGCVLPPAGVLTDQQKIEIEQKHEQNVIAFTQQKNFFEYAKDCEMNTVIYKSGLYSPIARIGDGYLFIKTTNFGVTIFYGIVLFLFTTSSFLLYFLRKKESTSLFLIVRIIAKSIIFGTVLYILFWSFYFFADCCVV